MWRPHPLVALRLLRWLALAVFLASAATAVAVRSSGWTDATSEGGHYYLSFRSTRVEVPADLYERTRRRDRIAWVATAAMMSSLLAYLGIRSLPLIDGAVRRR